MNSMYQFISIAAVVSYFIPISILIIKKGWRDIFFLLFSIHWLIGGLSNLLVIIPAVPNYVVNIVGVTYNMQDIPVMLTILYFTSSHSLAKRAALTAIFLVLFIQIVSAINTGFNYDALKYPLGAGVLMVLIIISMEIIRYMQKVEHSTRQNAKMLVYAALLFEYATFIVIYIFDYIIVTEERKDSFLIYYISTLVAIFIASCGYLMFRKMELNKRSY